KDPQHPYTWSLLQSIPRLDADRKDRLLSIEGLPPDLIKPPRGCRFHPRCQFRIERCFHDDPTLMDVGPDQEAACWVTMRRALARRSEERRVGKEGSSRGALGHLIGKDIETRTFRFRGRALRVADDYGGAGSNRLTY